VREDESGDSKESTNDDDKLPCVIGNAK